LPGDGSNTTPNIKESFQNWSLALVEAVAQFKYVILVAHSTGGMYALSTPKLEPLLEGLVLLDSAPDSGWQTSFAEELKKHPLPQLEILQDKYRKHPNHDTLKALTIASAPYLFTREGLKEGTEMLETLPYNCETCQWSEEHFDQTYEAKWIPQGIPTLILGGERDVVTPLRLFISATRFCRNNIVIKSIKNAGHFPWIENPADVAAAFQEYYQLIR
jgi:pimeloyl-ACP methyl ester carboxylesterase